MVVLCAAMAALPAFAGERAMSDREKQELQGAVEKILGFFERELGMRATERVELEFTTQEKIVEKARADGEKEEPEAREQRAARELLLKKLGLIPREFSLERYATESHPRLVLAYYSTETKKLYLLETLARGQREAVLLHELMHAVEDQHFALADYLRGGSKEAARAANQKEEAYDAGLDDGAFARRAVIEGHAMHATLEYLLWSSRNNPFGTNARQQLARDLEAAFPGPSRENKDLLKQTPPYLLESARFPYAAGLEFVRALQRSGGSRMAFQEPIARPPRSAREIMMPKQYLEKEPAVRLVLPKLAPLLAPEHKLLRIETAGQFDVLLLARQWAGQGRAAKLAPKWRGGVWYLFTRAAGDAKSLAPQDAELLYVAQWRDRDAAEDFAEAYAKAVGKKYRAAGKPARAGGRRTWQTEEGTVSVEAAGERVLVLEGFDAASAEKLREALLGAPSR